MARRLQYMVCERCERRFVPCRFNRHHQRFCGDEGCVAERRRERQRAWYRQRYEEDASFCEAERARCLAGVQKRRAAAVVVPVVDASVAVPEVPESVSMVLVTGLVAQLIGSADPAEVREAVRGFEVRGQRLTMGGALVRGSP